MNRMKTIKKLFGYSLLSGLILLLLLPNKAWGSNYVKMISTKSPLFDFLVLMLFLIPGLRQSVILIRNLDYNLASITTFSIRVRARLCLAKRIRQQAVRSDFMVIGTSLAETQRTKALWSLKSKIAIVSGQISHPHNSVLMSATMV